MSEKAEDSDEPEDEGEKKTINDPLTRRDVEAPRAEFKARHPKE